jgi:hypothetical protein
VATAPSFSMLTLSVTLTLVLPTTTTGDALVDEPRLHTTSDGCGLRTPVTFTVDNASDGTRANQSAMRPLDLACMIRFRFLPGAAFSLLKPTGRIKSDG